MPPLPKDRVILTKPFQTVGCGFLGPLRSKTSGKLYVCLYTCLTTRAVHLEAVEDLSAIAFLDSLIRFISRRRVPKIIRSDCGTNFKLGQRVIETLFQHDEKNEKIFVMSYSASRGIQWVFNPPGAPWMGEAWERLVGTVKRAIAKSVGRRKLTPLELHTLVTQIEAIINTRPLTALSFSVDNIHLKPIDFLQTHLKHRLTPTSSEEFEDPSYDLTLIHTMSQAKQALDHVKIITEKFWVKWHVDYLTALREIQSNIQKQPRHVKHIEPQLKEIVLVEQENLPRANWCYGKIVELVRSNDGLIRSAKLLMHNKHIWHRPLNKMYPLEICTGGTREISEDHTSNTAPDLPQSSEGDVLKSGRPTRAAKLKAMKTIRKLSEEHNEVHVTKVHGSNGLFNFVALTMIITMGCAVRANASINCANGIVNVKPPASKFELCIRSSCRYFENESQNLRLQLPFTAKNTMAKWPAQLPLNQTATVRSPPTTTLFASAVGVSYN
ncbi:hypothetical protein RB195_014206 [Necator americanus]|uniref:Integrase catalytic domain-containing protein n=1 Tax=Necator americanus TaxID=51031 RepID=A0ABR1E1S6_NECAM